MKTSDNYETLLRGVSQQPPSARLAGQHTEQVNMIPDPVAGLARRWGSVYQTSRPLLTSSAGLGNSRRLEYTAENRDYLLALPSGPCGTPAVPYNITDNLVQAVYTQNDDPLVAALLANGAAAACAVGKFVLIAPNSTSVVDTPVDKWSQDGGSHPGGAGRAAVWVRAGNYGKTYSLIVTRLDGTKFTVAYTMPAASYSGTLDTTNIPVFAADQAGGTTQDTEAVYATLQSGQYRYKLNWGDWAPSALTAKRGSTAMTNVHPAVPATATEFSWAAGDKYIRLHAATTSNDAVVTVTYSHTKVLANPNYSRMVTEVTNTYNAAVTAWITSAALAIKASTVATQLAALCAAQGVTATAVEGHVFLEGVADVLADDDGDGTLLLPVANTVSSVDKLTAMHYVGKTVRIQPTQSGDVFYMQATAKESGTTGWQDVIWIEGQATQHTLSGGLLFGVSSPDGLRFYLGGRAAIVAMCPWVTDMPDFAPSTVGDGDSAPVPYFVGRQVTYLGMFQDRLLIGAGSVIRASRVGEYLNFFRGSVLTAAADDTCEMLASSDAADTIKYGLLYERNLVLFGDRQYVLNGSAPLTPTNAVLPQMSAHMGASDAPPMAQGGLLFYVKRGPQGSSLWQMQPGQYAEAADANTVSPQLSTYIPPTSVDLTAVPEPAVLIVRTGAPRTLYLYQYLDTPQERVQAAWYRWEYAAQCGTLITVGTHNGQVLLMWVRGGEVVVDKQTLSADLSPTPYLDSSYTIGQVAQPWATHVAYSNAAHQGVGGTVAQGAEFVTTLGAAGLYAGVISPAYVQLTSPYLLDNKGRVRVTADLTIADLTATLSNSGGLTATVTSLGVAEEVDYPPEQVGTSPTDSVPFDAQDVRIPVFAKNTDYTLTLTSRAWLPLTINAVSWTGQAFNRT